MLGRVSRMSRLDCVRESLRLALQEVGAKLPPAQAPEWWPLLWDRYVDSQTDYRASQETLVRKFVEAGQDAQRLLDWLAEVANSPWAEGNRVELLRRVFGEQFEVSDPTAVQPRTKEQLASERVQNPHEPEATYGCKGRGEQRKEHVGYKVQVAETVSEATLAPGEPTGNFIVGIVTHAALEGDEEGGRKMEAEQAAMGLEKPSVNYVDAAYVSAEKLVQAAAEGRELIGPALPPPNNTAGRFQSEDFAVQVEQRRATCPAGHANSQCSRLVEKATGRVAYRFEWDTTTCAGCPLRLQCMKAEHPHRSLVVGEHHTVLQARRQEQQTDGFKARMKHRNAIEGTQSELVRAHGLRRARYRGLAKTKLQNYFAGAACNVKRWLRRVAWELRQGLPTMAAKLVFATS
jgi:transposase